MLNKYLFSVSPPAPKNAKNVHFEHFSPRSTRSTHRRAKRSHQKFAVDTLGVPAPAIFTMDDGRQRNAAGSARKTAAGRTRRAAASRSAAAAARLARSQHSDDSNHGSSSSGGDGSSGSSPSVGLSDAADDEAAEPRSAVAGGQRRGSKKPRTGASPPRRSASSLSLCGVAILSAMVCVTQARAHVVHLPTYPRLTHAQHTEARRGGALTHAHLPTHPMNCLSPSHTVRVGFAGKRACTFAASLAGLA